MRKIGTIVFSAALFAGAASWMFAFGGVSVAANASRPIQLAQGGPSGGGGSQMGGGGMGGPGSGMGGGPMMAPGAGASPGMPGMGRGRGRGQGPIHSPEYREQRRREREAWREQHRSQRRRGGSTTGTTPPMQSNPPAPAGTAP